MVPADRTRKKRAETSATSGQHAAQSPGGTQSGSGTSDHLWGLAAREETFRDTLPVRNPDREPATLIVTRQGMGRKAKTWVTFDGAWTSTAVLDGAETAKLIELLRTAAAT